MDSGKQSGSGSGWTNWYQNRGGGLAVWRALLVLALLTALSAVIAVSAGMSSGATAAIMLLLAVTLVHALVLTPVARLTLAAPARARESAPDTEESLSGIANRRSITAALLNAMAYANRYNHPLSVAKVEIETLRDISHSLGRKAGDKALQAVGAVFLETLRMPDRAGRYGDEDFLIILPNTLLKNATQIAERLRNRVEHADAARGRSKLPLTVNIGIAQFRKGEDLERFLSRVDKALSDARKSGHRRVSAERSA